MIGGLFSVLHSIHCVTWRFLVTRASLSERLQSAAFVGIPEPNSENMTMYQSRVTVEELQTFGLGDLLAISEYKLPFVNTGIHMVFLYRRTSRRLLT